MRRKSNIPEHDNLPPMNQEELDEIIQRHDDFLAGVLGGLRALVQYRDLSGLDMGKTDLSQADFTGSNLSKCDLSNGNFTGVVFFACDLRHANLEQSNFTNADFRGASVIGANFLGADLMKADMREGQIMIAGRDGEMTSRESASGLEGRTVLSGAKLADTNMSGLRAHNADFSGADLAGAIIQNADLSHVDFSGANLADTDFSGSDMSYIDLTDSVMSGAVLEQISDRDLDLSGIVMDVEMGKRLESVGKSFEELLAVHKRWITSSGKRGEQLDLSGFDLRDILNLGHYPLTAIKARHANFMKQNLSGVDMQSVYCDASDFRDCRLDDADLRGSSFRDANFARADLSGALLCPLEFGGKEGAKKVLKRTDISGADLSYTVLKGTDLRHCIMMGVNLTHADLSGSDLRGADLSGAVLEGTVMDDVLLENTVLDQDAVIKGE